MFPDDSVQSLTREWWIAHQSGAPTRGRLLWTFVPYPDMKPHRLVPEGRGEDARQHTRANFRIEPFRIDAPSPPAGTLPVAALPLRDGEVYHVQRGKIRPAVVISSGGADIPREIRQGNQRWQSARTLLVAPFYGADPGGTRGGWPAPFGERIRRAEYPQYTWDKLPIESVSESILRLDHIFPIGAEPGRLSIGELSLGDEALAFLDEWVEWLVTGTLPGDSLLASIREGLGNL